MHKKMKTMEKIEPREQKKKTETHATSFNVQCAGFIFQALHLFD